MGNNESTSLLAVASRITWMMIGPMLLVLILFTMIRSPGGWLSLADLVFFSVLAGMMLARWLEFQSGNPQTAEGLPATSEHLRRYLLVLLGGGFGLWMIAKLFASAVALS